MAAFDLALSCIRDGAGDLLRSDHINQLALVDNHLFRNTTLTPGNTLRLFVRQVAHGNIACSAVRHLAGEDFSDSAWCQARGRLPEELIQRVHRQVVDQGRRELDFTDDAGNGIYRWRGHRLHVMDGSSDSMPDTPELRSHYGVPAACAAGLGFPTSHLLFLIDHRSGLLVDCRDDPGNTHDASVAPTMHEHLRPGDILLGDDAFGTYTHLALLLRADLHAIMPVHHKRIVDFTPGRGHAHPRGGKSTRRAGKPRSRVVRTLGRDDQLVEYFKPPKKPDWMNDERWRQIPESILVREIRRTVKRHGFRPITVTIVTTLLDPDRYPADELIELRLTRWMVETNIRHLKIMLRMNVLKCKTLEGVRKERLIFLLVYNLIRIVMLRAARRQNVNVNRLSFADTLAWLRHGHTSICPVLIINPHRPGRIEPRALKGGKRRFPYMTSPRAKLKSQLRAKYQDMS
jgi:hypothetical protein